MKPKPNISKLLIATLLLLIATYTMSAFKPVREPIKPHVQESSMYFSSKNCPPFTIKVRILGSIITSPTIRDLIDCESKGKIYAENLTDIHKWKDGTLSIGSFGILQFGKPTFQEFCVEKYGLRNDLFSPEIQIRCAEKMISQNYEQRWGCWEIINPTR